MLRTPDAVIRIPPHTDRACSGCQSPGNGACPHGENRFKTHRSRTGRFTSAARRYAALTRILVAAANQTFGAANIAACTISRRFAIPASPHPGLIAESSHFPLPQSVPKRVCSARSPRTAVRRLGRALPTSHFSLLTSHFPNAFPNATAVLLARGLPSGGSEGHFPLLTSHFPLLTSHFPLLTSPMRSQTRLQCT